jgi:predicted RNase H-like HicB family nuclease
MEVTEDKDEGGFAFSCPELKGCITCADTLEEGYRMLEDAKREWFASCIDEGLPIPEPVFNSGYSGQFNIRMPKSLHKSLAKHAKDEGVSMNQYCLYLLSQVNSMHSIDSRKRDIVKK